MASIPFSLVMSNSSTLLTWLCVYVPHNVLLSLLAAGLLLLALLVIGTLCLVLTFLCRLAKYVTNRPAPSPHPRTPPRAPAHIARPRLDLRHHSSPAQLVPLRCPHCLTELIQRPSLTAATPSKPNAGPAPTSPIMARRASDSTPTTRAVTSSDSFPSDSDRMISTPPHRDKLPQKTPLRRSPRPHKPRKLES